MHEIAVASSSQLSYDAFLAHTSGNISCFWHLIFGINVYAVASFTLTAFLDLNRKTIEQTRQSRYKLDSDKSSHEMRAKESK